MNRRALSQANTPGRDPYNTLPSPPTSLTLGRQAPADTPDSLLREALGLCAIGDIDETAEAHGWGDWCRRARAIVRKAGR